MVLSPEFKLGLQTLRQLLETSNNAFGKGVLAVATSIVESVGSARATTEDIERLAKRILDSSITVAAALQTRLNDPSGLPQEDTLFHAGEFIRSLERIHAALEKPTSRGRFGKILARSRDKLSLKNAEEDMENCVASLSIHLQLKNLRLAERIEQNMADHRGEMEKSIILAQDEQKEYVKAKMIDHTFKENDARLSVKTLPSPPQIFFGRSGVLSDAVQVLTADKPGYVAVLGPGGIGKTTLAVAILHDERVITTYGKYIYFIPCEAINDPDGLSAALSRMFSLPEDQPIVHLRRIFEALGKRILMLLDNFETPWEQKAGRSKVEELLAQLVDIPNVSLIVTLRGAERPYGIPWSRPFLPPLDVLDVASAVQTFVAISDADPNDEIVAQLVDVVEYMPLAITLMASQAQFLSCHELLERWNSEKTAMVTRGFEGRLSSLDVSIQVSMSSPRLAEKPDGRRLLQVLSYLPDGIPAQSVQAVLPSEVNAATALPTLLQVALARRDSEGRIRVLSPIQEYIRAREPIDAELFEPLFKYHTDLTAYVASCEHTRNISEMIGTIAPQFGNIQSVIYHGFDTSALAPAAVNAALNLHIYYDATAFGASIPPLMERALVTANELGILDSEARCRLYQASHYRQDDPRRKESLFAALDLYRKSGSASGLLTALLKCSAYHRLNGDFKDSFELLQEAEKLVNDASPDVDRISLYQYQANTLLAADKLNEGMAMAKKGVDAIDVSKLPTLAANNFVILGYGESKRCLFTRAVTYGHRALELTGGAGWQGTQTMNLLADNLLFLSQISEARHHYLRAYEIAATFDEVPMMASLQADLAREAMANGDAESALVRAHMAVKMFQTIESRHDQARCYGTIGQAEFVRGNHETGMAYLLEAWRIYRECKIIGSWRDYTILMPMADILFETQRYSDSETCLITAILVCRKSGIRLGMSQCLQRIGDIFYQEESTRADAASCYTASLEMIRYLGVGRHIGDCFVRLAMISIDSQQQATAGDQLQRARTFYSKSEHSAGADFCDRTLDSLKDGTNDVSLNVTDLPLATTIHFI